MVYDNKEIKENIKTIQKELGQELKQIRNVIKKIKRETKNTKNTATQNKKAIEKQIELMSKVLRTHREIS